MNTETLPADNRSFTAWFVEFLRNELAPYPGRGALVARMVISATITMILVMTFRIPNGATGPLYAFLIARDSLLTTARSARNVLIAFALCALFVPVGARMFGSVPITHFLWEAASIFLIFFLIRTLDNYSVASAIGLMATSALAVWYLPGPAEHNVEYTLWQIVSPAIGAAVTIAVEAIFYALFHEDELLRGLSDRLMLIEQLLICYTEHSTVPRTLNRRLSQATMIGVGGLRRIASRANATPIHRAQMNAVVSLVGRSVDFAAALAHTAQSLSEEDLPSARQLASQIAHMRHRVAASSESLDLRNQDLPDQDPQSRLLRSRDSLDADSAQPAASAAAPVATLPLLRELEEMFSLIPRVLSGTESLEAYDAFTERALPQSRVFVRDAFHNPEHLRYALGGCLAGMLCYVLYVSLSWPGLATSVTTCVLTALSNIGSSRQKQILRLAGAVIGGFVFGMGAQIVVLPWLNSIAGFTMLFVAVSAVAAWIATSSARLSYCGLQIALAFYLINVNDFHIQLSLAIARDRALGVLLGVSMMWLVFERLHPRTATDAMLDTFIANLRLLAQFSTLALAHPDAQSIARVRRLRTAISNNFANVNAQADAVPFEIGAARPRHMAARDHIRRWQAMLRTYFLLELALLQYAAFSTAATLSEQDAQALIHFDSLCARRLEALAAQLDAQRRELPVPESDANLRKWPDWLTRDSTAKSGALPLAREIFHLLDRVADEMQTSPIFEMEDTSAR